MDTWKKGLFHVMVANGLFAVVAFGSQLFVVNFLTDDELGYIKIFQSITQILGILAGGGLSTSVLILCASAEPEQEKEKIFLVGVKLIIPLSILIWLGFIGLNKFGLWSEISEVKELLGWYSSIALIAAFTAIVSVYFQALRIFKKFSYLMISTKILSLGIITIMTWQFGFMGFIHGLWIGLLFSLLLNVGYLVRVFKGPFYNVTDRFTEIAKDHFRIGLNGLGANVFGVIAISMDVLMMNFLIPDQTSLIGQYSFATIIILGLNMFQGSIIQVTMPYFSKHTANKDALVKNYAKYSAIHVAASVAIFLFLFLFLTDILGYFYADKFSAGLAFLQSLLLVWLFRSCNAINIAFLSGTGLTKSVNIINFIYAALLLVVTYVGLKYYTIEMMIQGIMIATIFVLLLGLGFSRKAINNL